MLLTVDHFKKSFGAHQNEISEKLTILINEFKLELILIQGKDLEKLLIEIIEIIRKDQQVIASSARTKTWHDGWYENLEEFKSSRVGEEALLPRFVRSGLPIRWNQKYYNVVQRNFEEKYIQILRQYIFEVYFNQVEHLYEFGAGTGHNLVHASKCLPGTKLIGTDFVQPAVDLMNEVARKLKINLTTNVFDMLRPADFNLKLNKNSGVLTFGALEQLGGNIAPMIEFLIENKPSIVVHIEPIAELYDLEILEDYLAHWFQTKRGYSSGIISLLNSYEKKEKIKIIKQKRLNFGSKMMEGYNLLVWAIND